MKILAVCLGNICRSPVAAAAIRDAAARHGLDVEVDSAGLGSWHIGQPPHPDSVAAGAQRGLEVTGTARRVTMADFDKYDVILAMDRSNLDELLEMAPSAASRAKIRLFRTFDPDTLEDEIPDPWGGPIEGYHRTAELALRAADGLVNHLVRSAKTAGEMVD